MTTDELEPPHNQLNVRLYLSQLDAFLSSFFLFKCENMVYTTGFTYYVNREACVAVTWITISNEKAGIKLRYCYAFRHVRFKILRKHSTNIE